MRTSLALIAVALAAPAAGAPPLSAARDHARVLIVAAPDPAGIAAQDRLLAADRAGLGERDVRIVRVTGATVTGVSDDATAMRCRFAIAPSAFAVRLVGKDGHVAFAADRPVTPARLFATIDAMPMRRDEMARARR